VIRKETRSGGYRALTCLPCARPWVPSPARKDKKKEKDERATWQKDRASASASIHRK
jgi:hypothetical protein